MKTLVAITVGAALGVIASQVLFVGPALTVIPFALAGLVLGEWFGRPKDMRWPGGLSEFSLALVSSLMRRAGRTSLATRKPQSALFGSTGTSICRPRLTPPDCLATTRLRR
jgi:hypothetical protein